MSLTLSEARLCPNHLLARLTDEQLQALVPRLKLVHNCIKEVIYERNQRISHVHFPCSCALSNILFLEDGAAVEVATVGNEGFSAVEVLVGATLATDSCVCQIAGKSLRMEVGDFRDAVHGITPLRHVAECYCQAYLSSVSQSVACNRRHTVEARFARWLLITHDRVHGDEFYLTQEFLADMLGTQRPTVSNVAAAFQNDGMIEYRRGHMRILNRAALEQTACECYATVRGQFKRLLGQRYG
jgi:hypothetical protein